MGRILSDTPGRLRLRVRPDCRSPEFMHGLHEHVKTTLPASSVETHARRGSVIIRYDRGRHTTDDILAVLRDIGVMMEDVSESIEPWPLSMPEHSTSAQSLANAIDDLNRRILYLTGWRVDLRFLFPLTIGVLGAYKVMRHGLQIADVPAAILLYYAFDSFQKLHATPLGSPRAGEAMLESGKSVAGAVDRGAGAEA